MLTCKSHKTMALGLPAAWLHGFFFDQVKLSKSVYESQEYFWALKKQNELQAQPPCWCGRHITSASLVNLRLVNTKAKSKLDGRWTTHSSHPQPRAFLPFEASEVTWGVLFPFLNCLLVSPCSAVWCLPVLAHGRHTDFPIHMLTHTYVLLSLAGLCVSHKFYIQATCEHFLGGASEMDKPNKSACLGSLMTRVRTLEPPWIRHICNPAFLKWNGRQTEDSPNCPLIHTHTHTHTH